MTEAASTLVIGGAEFLGSHLVSRLAKSDRQVTVLGRHLSPLRELPAAVK